MTFREFLDSVPERNERDVRELDRQLTRHYREARDRIQAEIDKLYARALAGADPKDYYALTVRFNRLNRLQGQVKDAYERAAGRAGIEIQRASRLTMSQSYYANQYALQLGVNTGQGIALSFTRLPEELIEFAVVGTQDAWRKIVQERMRVPGDLDAYRPPAGTLNDILLNRTRRDLQRVQDTIVQALIQGKNATQMSGELSRALSISRNNAQRIIRTETHRTQSLGHYAASEHAKEQGARVRRQIVSVLDDRTRPQSAAVDGQMENEDGYFVYPGGVMVRVPGSSGVAGWDINDREVAIDVVEGLEPETRRMRNPETGRNEVISWRSFDKWAKERGLTRNRYGQLL